MNTIGGDDNINDAYHSMASNFIKRKFITHDTYSL